MSVTDTPLNLQFGRLNIRPSCPCCFIFTGGPEHFARPFTTTMTQVERKDQIVTWNGDPQFWLEYVKRVRLQYERTEYRKRGLLGAELASRLTSRAWDIASAELDHNQLQKPDGAAYLLRFLEQRLCKAPIPDTGQRLEEFFMKIRRVPGSSMAEWSAQLREAYRRLQRAMARQRKDQADREPTKAIQSSKLSTPTPRRRSDVTSPGRGRTLFTPTGSEAYWFRSTSTS